MSRLTLNWRVIAIALFVAVATFTGTAPALMAQTLTPAPTQTPAPTLTPEPTLTPAPTQTPAPTLTPEPTLTPAPTQTPAPTLTINGSERMSMHVVTTDSIAFNASSGWIAFFSDSACATYLGLMESPSDDAASAYEGIWGRTFFVAGATRSGTPTTTCRQVTISPPMFLTINGSQGRALLQAEEDLVIGLPGGQADSYSLWLSVRGDCTNVTARQVVGGNTIIRYAELLDLPGFFGNALFVQAERTVDGAQTDCRMVEWLREGDVEPTPVTPGMTEIPQPTGTVPPTGTAPVDPTSNAQSTSTPPVSLLPSTGGGGGDASSGMPGWLLGAAFTLLMAAVAVGRRQRDGA